MRWLRFASSFPAWRGRLDGYISATDWVLLATLIPSTSTEIKNRHGVDPLNLRGQNYSRGYRRYDGRGEYRVYVR